MKTKFPYHLRKISVNYVSEINPEILKRVSSRQVFYREMLKSKNSICSWSLVGICLLQNTDRSGEPGKFQCLFTFPVGGKHKQTFLFFVEFSHQRCESYYIIWK